MKLGLHTRRAAPPGSSGVPKGRGVGRDVRSFAFIDYCKEILLILVMPFLGHYISRDVGLWAPERACPKVTEPGLEQGCQEEPAVLQIQTLQYSPTETEGARVE